MKTGQKVIIRRIDGPGREHVYTGYEVEGTLLEDIDAGVPVSLDRQRRNGVVTPGIFITSMVTYVNFDNNQFQTESGSTYLVEKVKK